MSEYFLSLAQDVKQRYYEKTSLINFIDPYDVTPENAKNLAVSFKDLPSIQLHDIISYFVYTHSYFTKDLMLCYKSLRAIDYLEGNRVLNICFYKIGHFFLILGKIKHSQKQNEKPLMPWIILCPNGSIASAHCNCMAGLGEACSHISATAFSLCFQGSPDVVISCTDKLSQWVIPSKANSKIEPKQISKINFGKPIQTKAYINAIKIDVPPLLGDELQNFLVKLDEIHPDAAILNVFEPFASAREKKAAKNLPMSFDDLHLTDNYSQYSLKELIEMRIELTITADDQAAVEMETRDQSKSDSWYKYRAGRITASNFKKACRTSINRPSLSLLKTVCYPNKVIFKTKATDYGLKNESKARALYLKNAQKQHNNFKVDTCGFIISLKSNIFGSSCDGLVVCDCCGNGCWEGKCPYTCFNLNISVMEFIKSGQSCLEYKLINGQDIISFKKQHEYYYQIQMQMYCTERKYCDFSVWSKFDIYTIRENFDEQFLIEHLSEATLYHQKVVIPELLSRWFTKSRINIEEVELCCYCKQRDDGVRDMVSCGNFDECEIKFFHVDCVIMEMDCCKEEGIWICQFCKVNFTSQM